MSQFKKLEVTAEVAVTVWVNPDEHLITKEMVRESIKRGNYELLDTYDITYERIEEEE